VLVDGHDQIIDPAIQKQSTGDLAILPSSERSVRTKTFKVVLPAASFVDRIVIQCLHSSVESHGQISPQQFLISLWPSEEQSHSGTPADELVNGASHIAASPLQGEQGNFRFEIDVKQVAAVISLEVQPFTNRAASGNLRGLNPSSGSAEGDSLCGKQRRAVEIEVLGKDVHVIRTPSLEDETEDPRNTSDEEMSHATARRQYAGFGVSTDTFDIAVEKENLPERSIRDQLHEHLHTVPLHTAATWIMWNSWTLIITACAFALVYSCRAGKSIPAEFLPELDGLNELTRTAAGPAFFYIGDEDESSVQGATCQTEESASEPEPEVELDPPTHPSSPAGTPRGQGAMPSIVCAGTQLREVQPAPICSEMAAARQSFLPPPNIIVATSEMTANSAKTPWTQALQAFSTHGVRQKKVVNKGQIVMLFSAPLCAVGAQGPAALPHIPFPAEWNIMMQAHAEAVDSSHTSGTRARRQAFASLVPRPLTASNLQRLIAPSSPSAAASVLHLSAHTMGDSLVLENGKRPCTAHILNCDQLSAMLNLRKDSAHPDHLRLVILNACSSKSVGLRFAQSGVPHVICTVNAIMDSWSRPFMHKLYSCLLQGLSVRTAFRAAQVALASGPETPEEAAASFCLLPEEDPHDEILFPSDSTDTTARSARTSTASDIDHDPGGFTGENEDSNEHTEDCNTNKSKIQRRTPTLPRWVTPLNRPVPLAPEDFVGRAVDIWSVQQHLTSRRVVVVCGDAMVTPGIGKTSVVNAVHRALTLQLGAICVPVNFRGMGCEKCRDENESNCSCWLMRMREAIRRTIEDLNHEDCNGVSRRCTGPRRCFQQPRHHWKWDVSGSESADSNSSCGACLTGINAEDLKIRPLVTDMQELARMSREVRFGGDWWPATAANGPFAGGPAAGEGGGALIILDDCDHLVQQQYFQETISSILRQCPGYRLLLSTQQPIAMVGPSLCQFKVVHHSLQGLSSSDAARLFLRRTSRQILWEELLQPEESGGMVDLKGPVTLTSRNEAEVLRLVSQCPAVAAQLGNPKALIELGSKVNSSLASLKDLPSDPLLKSVAVASGTSVATPPMQKVMALTPSCAPLP
jgi:hypothetical protein